MGAPNKRPFSLGIQNYCDDTQFKGIIPRAVEQIFNTVNEADNDIEFCIKVSYVEIYMERVRDLFDRMWRDEHTNA